MTQIYTNNDMANNDLLAYGSMFSSNKPLPSFAQKEGLSNWSAYGHSTNISNMNAAAS